MAGGTRDIETIVVPPGTAHTEPADSLIATLFGDSLVDSGGAALWVANSFAPGLEELAEPMRGTIGRGGAAVMRGTLKDPTTPSPHMNGVPNPLAPAVDLAAAIEQLEPALGPRSPSRTRRSLRACACTWTTALATVAQASDMAIPMHPAFLHQ